MLNYVFFSLSFLLENSFNVIDGSVSAYMLQNVAEPMQKAFFIAFTFRFYQQVNHQFFEGEWFMQRSGWCVWVTGLPGSGKSVVAQALLDRLEKRRVHAQIVSSDMLRKVVTPKPTYSEAERDIVYGTIVYVAKLLTKNGVNVIIDATGNRRRYRDQARKEISRFMEVYLQCPLEVCIQRETGRKRLVYAPKGIYKKAFTGKSATVPGIGVPYEEPLHPEVTVNSEKLTAEQCAQEILEAMQKASFLV